MTPPSPAQKDYNEGREIKCGTTISLKAYFLSLVDYYSSFLSTMLLSHLAFSSLVFSHPGPSIPPSLHTPQESLIRHPLHVISINYSIDRHPTDRGIPSSLTLLTVTDPQNSTPWPLSMHLKYI